MYNRKFFLKAIALMAILLPLKFGAYAQNKEKVLILGESNKLTNLVSTQSADSDITFVTKATDIEQSNAQVLILASQNLVGAAYRLAVHHFVKKGGSVVFIGKQNFDYGPDFINGTLITDLKKDFDVVWPKGDFTIASMDN